MRTLHLLTAGHLAFGAALASSATLPTQQFGPAVHVRLDGELSWEGKEAIAIAGDDDCGSGSSSGSAGSSGREGVLHLLPGLLPPDEVSAVLRAATRRLEFDETPDTVDAEATYLCRVISDGEAVDAEMEAALAPLLEERLLPFVRARFGCSTACVADVLIRRYLPSERRSLSAHFDVSAFATCIVPLSEAHEYEGGLYVQAVPGVDSRRYLDLQAGDALVHRFDTMHGVDVQGGSRFSLVAWFSDSLHSIHANTAPWVEVAARQGNAAAQFVLSGFHYRGEFGYAMAVEEAVRCLTASAKQGNPLAQLHLGSMCSCGEVEAAWLHRAELPYELLGGGAPTHGEAATGLPSPAPRPSDDLTSEAADVEALDMQRVAAALYRRSASQGHPTAFFAARAATGLNPTAPLSPRYLPTIYPAPRQPPALRP